MHPKTKHERQTQTDENTIEHNPFVHRGGSHCPINELPRKESIDGDDSNVEGNELCQQCRWTAAVPISLRQKTLDHAAPR